MKGVKLSDIKKKNENEKGREEERGREERCRVKKNEQETMEDCERV